MMTSNKYWRLNVHIPGTTVIDPRRVLLTMSGAEANQGEQSPTLVDVGSD